MSQTAPTVPDVDLVDAIRKGEAAAETVLYQKYAARVYYLGLRDLGSREDAEDIRAETFLRVFQAVREGRVRTPEALAGFVLGSAKNVIRELRRKRQRLGEPLAQDDDVADPAARDTVFADPIVQRTIKQVAEQLKPREQAFLRMYYYEDLLPEEIAGRLGVRTERVRLIKSRALKSFREVYHRLLGDEP